MSWWIQLAAPANNKPALKARIQAHDAPQDVRDELCRRVDELPGGAPGTAIVVVSWGHVETYREPKNPYAGATELRFIVGYAPYLDTPLPVSDNPPQSA